MVDTNREQALDSLKDLIKNKAEDTTVVKKANSVIKTSNTSNCC